MYPSSNSLPSALLHTSTDRKTSNDIRDTDNKSTVSEELDRQESDTVKATKRAEPKGDQSDVAASVTHRGP